mmetsp:Transcript_11364/g.42417  ORF Transcript_11364/g.42417 Transcript_11364/m.42417 type:complete len:234 (+) Transcript_11364:260-961(+)
MRELGDPALLGDRVEEDGQNLALKLLRNHGRGSLVFFARVSDEDEGGAWWQFPLQPIEVLELSVCLQVLEDPLLDATIEDPSDSPVSEAIGLPRQVVISVDHRRIAQLKGELELPRSRRQNRQPGNVSNLIVSTPRNLNRELHDAWVERVSLVLGVYATQRNAETPQVATRLDGVVHIGHNLDGAVSLQRSGLLAALHDDLVLHGHRPSPYTPAKEARQRQQDSRHQASAAHA